MKVKKILISQQAPASDKSPFSELTSKYKVEVDFRPFITVQGVTLKEFRAQRIDIAGFTAVIFTSRKTIDNFFRICEEGRIQVSEEMKYFCVTEAIALYLQKYIVYRKRKIFYGAGTFAALMDVVAKHKGEKYLVALSNPYKPEIEQLMDKTGVKYSKAILAHTMPADLGDVVITDYDLVACYSSGDVRALNQNFKQLPQGLIIAALGNATAREMAQGGLKVDILAPTPKYPSMTMAIEGYLKALNNGQRGLEEFGYKVSDPVAIPGGNNNKRAGKVAAVGTVRPPAEGKKKTARKAV